MEIQKTRAQFKAKLAASGWDRVLNEFIDSSEFETLMKALAVKHVEGVLTPSIKQVFRPFYECPYKDLSIIIMGQDPYPEEGEADGLAFSSGNNRDITPELKVMFQEIQDTVYKPINEDWYSWDPDLTRWSRQGILLISSALTTEIGKVGMHYDIWKPFIDYLFKKLAEINTGIIYVFMGAAAREWAKKIPESNYKFYCYHPASAFYTGGEWESNDVFNRACEIVESNNGTKIIW
jgi:uracil-DNA glycosylase